MKKWLNIFIYVSLGFIIYAVWKADYLKFPSINNYYYLFISIALLLSSYVSKSFVWLIGLKSGGIGANIKNAIVSTGLGELGKYIPGKLWAVLGRAMYISLHYPIKIAQASAISFNVQILTIWSGLMVGAIGMFFVKVPESWTILMAVAWLLLSLAIFVHKIHNFLEKTLKKVIKKEIKIPFINVFERKEILLWLLIDWFVRLTAFYFFINAVSSINISYGVALGFPLAVTLGILAVIVPGGLGVREGILVFWLQNIGLDIELATTIAISSRLWSLSGELTIFALAMILKKRK